MFIECFRAGEHTDASGQVSTWDTAKLDNIVKIYNNQLEVSRHDAPVVIGHPETDAPAYAWVSELKREGESLYANLRDINEEFKEIVRSGAYKKVSIALYDNDLLKHIGFLGATPPAIKGLKEASFKENRNFKEYFNSQTIKEKPTMIDKFIQQVFDYISEKYDIDVANDILAKMNELKPEIEEPKAPENPETPEAQEPTKEGTAEQAYSEENKQVTELTAQVKALQSRILADADNKFFSEVIKEGKILDKQRPELTKILTVLREPNKAKQFSEDGKADALLMNFVRSLTPQIQFNEFAKSAEFVAEEQKYKQNMTDFINKRHKRG